MRKRLGLYASVAFVLGMTAGAVVWGAQMHRFRRDLFNSSPVRRLAALGYLGGGDHPASAGLLRDYLSWEPSQVLRKRAARMLRQLEARHS